MTENKRIALQGKIWTKKMTEAKKKEQLTKWSLNKRLEITKPPISMRTEINNQIDLHFERFIGKNKREELSLNKRLEITKPPISMITGIDERVNVQLERILGKEKIKEAEEKEKISESIFVEKLEITKIAINDDKNKIKFLAEVDGEIQSFLDCVYAFGSEPSKLSGFDHILLSICKNVFWSKRNGIVLGIKRKYRRVKTIQADKGKELEQLQKFTRIYKDIYRYIWLIRFDKENLEKIIHWNQHIFIHKLETCENSQGIIFMQL